MLSKLSRLFKSLAAGDKCPQCLNGYMQYYETDSKGEILQCAKCDWKYRPV
jgi:Zn ribbon nucleic-acid-binding protein